MERLTKRTTEGIVVKEDYGEEVLKTLYQCFGAEVMPHYANCEEGYCAMERLAAYEDAEEKGLLMRLPCKVGDTIWDIDFGKPCSYEVTGFSYGSLNEDDYEEEEKLSDEVIVYYKNWNGSITGNFPVSEIGKTVFLTKEEADQALKQMGEREDE